MDFTDSYDFSAAAEVVFNTMTDPARTSGWLPPGVVVDPARTHRVVIDAGGITAEYRLFTVADEMSLSWWPMSGPDLHGTAQVRDSAAGGSTVQLRICDPDRRLDVERTRRLVATAMRDLASEVSENFTPG